MRILDFRRHTAVALTLATVGIAARTLPVRGVEPLDDSKSSGATEAFVRLDRPAGWGVGAGLRFDDREFTESDTVIPMEARSAVARVGYGPVPALYGYGELGWVEAKDEEHNIKGEGGLAWGAGLYGNLVQYVMRSSPVVDRKQVLSLGGEVAYRSYESNLPDADFSWSELILMPTVQYGVSFSGIRRWEGFDPAEVLTRGGLVFSRLDGDLGDQSLEGNRDFGLHLAVDLRWTHSWVFGVFGNFYGTHDRALGLNLGYYF